MKTPPKKLILLIFLILFSFLSTAVVTSSEVKADECDPPWTYYQNQGYTIERVYDQGEWYIYVYDDRQTVVAIYEDD
jgi:hypothetical protein